MTTGAQAGQTSISAPTDLNEMLAEERLPPFLRVTLRRWAKWYSGSTELFWPFTDLVMRVFVGLWFLRSGLVKAAHYDTALSLATYEYPVSWMMPDHAAMTGLTIELAGSILLLAGFITRPAAVALAALTIVSQIVYIPTTTNLVVIALLIWYMVHGPAAFSLDRVLAAGMKASALPLARPAILAREWSRENLSPILIALVRVWLGLALLNYADVIDPPIAVQTWLPSTVFSGFPDWLSIPFAILLIAGLGAGVVSYLLFFLIGFFMISDVNPNVTLFPFLLLGLYETRGAGVLSIDRIIGRWMERNILFDRHYSEIPDRWPHVVVVGAGFGGLAAVDKLKRLPLRITLIDKRNYHLFQPLLYQIATATLNPSDIAIPIRSLFRADANVRVLKGEVKGIDPEARVVTYDDGQELMYDRLVLATGATHSYFGKDEWGAFAPALKTVEDAVAVRSSILDAFEQAEASGDSERVKRLLTFVIVGAGPTGVELAGAIAELAKMNVEREFRTIDPADARVILVQSGPRILPAFPKELSAKAAESLEELGVEIRTGGRVTEIAEQHVRIGEDTLIESETVLWAAGVAASPAAKWLNAKADRSGRAEVDFLMRVVRQDGEPYRDIYAIGDTADSAAWDGKPVPGLAPAAKQAGAYISRLLEAELLDKPCPGPFVYDHKGSLATIGRKSAVADFGRVQMSGASAWWLWGVIHVGFLTGARNRLTVTINWGWNFFARHSGVRLITGRET